jgi:polyhydroxyalkanoate synthesis repressor PhaR
MASSFRRAAAPAVPSCIWGAGRRLVNPQRRERSAGTSRAAPVSFVLATAKDVFAAAKTAYAAIEGEHGGWPTWRVYIGDESMVKSKDPTTIKKYANRRLYNTGTSTYVTLEDLGAMVKAGEDFVVYDAKSNEDITRQVLTQIIFEQENKGQNLLPITFLRQLIRFYGDSIQAIVPSFLEFSIDNLTREQQKIRDQMTQQISAGWGKNPWSPGTFGSLEEQAKNNMAVFERAFRMFSPFNEVTPENSAEQATKSKDDDIDDLKKELAEMRDRLDRITDPKR